MQPNFDTSEIDDFVAKIKNAYPVIVRNSLTDFKFSQSADTRRTYQDASKRTPYADGSKSTFGIKTGKLLEDISRVKMTSNSVEQSSDLSYSKRIDDLFRSKGTLKNIIPLSDFRLADALRNNTDRYFS